MSYLFLLSILVLFGPSMTEATIKHSIYNKQQKEAFLKQFDKVQQHMETIISHFIEKKELKLLDKPVISRGKFYYRKPNHILWEYEKPHLKKFLLTGNILLSYYPEEKKAEQVNIRRFSSHLFRFFCIGQLSRDLKDYYKIEISNSPDSKDVLMTLIPKKRKWKKKLKHLKVWIDRKTFQFSQLQFTEMDGDQTTLIFKKMNINSDLPASIFEIHLPPDVEIKNELTGFLNDQ